MTFSVAHALGVIRLYYYYYYYYYYYQSHTHFFWKTAHKEHSLIERRLMCAEIDIG